MIKSILALLLVVGCVLITLTAPVQAKDLFSTQVCQSPDTQKSAVCTDNSKTNAQQDPISGRNGLIWNITNIVSYIGGAAAIIVILVSAIRFITSGSDISTGARHDNDVENARRSLAGALIGLTVIVLAHSIILFVLQKF